MIIKVEVYVHNFSLKFTQCSVSWQPNEDVTYASINHTNVRESRRAMTTSNNDCDYATVNVPAELLAEAESDTSSKEECADDYVLMG